jgi:hypothetical protein
MSNGMEMVETVEGVCKALTEQHGEVSGLLHRVSDDPDNRAELLVQDRGGR